jgi:hypothetical protein
MFPRDHLGGFLADHDRGSVGVAADDVRHDTGVRHAQVADAHHLQRGINDIADAAGAAEVVDGGGEVQRHKASLGGSPGT